MDVGLSRGPCRMSLSSVQIGLGLLATIGVIPAHAGAAYDFHGLLFQCGRHPVVQISGVVAYAYQDDLTHYVEGRATLRRNAVLVSFPGRVGAFTIIRLGNRFMSAGRVCKVDDV